MRGTRRGREGEKEGGVRRSGRDREKIPRRFSPHFVSEGASNADLVLFRITKQL